MKYTNEFYVNRLIPFLTKVFQEASKTDYRNYFGLTDNAEQKKQKFKTDYHAQFYGAQKLFQTEEERSAFTDQLFFDVRTMAAANIPLRKYFFPDEEGNFTEMQKNLISRFSRRVTDEMMTGKEIPEMKAEQKEVQKKEKETVQSPAKENRISSSAQALRENGLEISGPLIFDEKTDTVTGTVKTASGEELKFEQFQTSDGRAQYRFTFLNLPDEKDAVTYGGKSFALSKEELWRFSGEPSKGFQPISAREFHDEKNLTRMVSAPREREASGSAGAEPYEEISAHPRERMQEHMTLRIREKSDAFRLSEHGVIPSRRGAAEFVFSGKRERHLAPAAKHTTMFERLKERLAPQARVISDIEQKAGGQKKVSGTLEKVPDTLKEKPIFPETEKMPYAPMIPFARKPASKKKKGVMGKIVVGSIGGFLGGVAVLTGFHVFFT